jgi:hypothetical protein
LARKWHFPYTSQPFSLGHKSEKIFESGSLFAIWSLVRGLALSVS